MLSKLLRPARMVKRHILKPSLAPTYRVTIVRSSSLIPPSQYDIPIPKKLNIFHVMRVYWETIPLFVTTAIALGIMFAAIAWACKNKVDVVFHTNSRDSISRTMDLRQPTVHKMVIINQRYEPWPEMQDVLDKMKAAEKRAAARLQNCAYVPTTTPQPAEEE